MLKCRWVRFCLVSVNLVLFIIYGCTRTSKMEKDLLHQKCGLCHPLKVALDKNRSSDEWKRVIHGMKLRGLKINESEEREILEYLIENYGK